MTAERFQIDAKTVREWRDRFLAEGEAGLWDRPSRPHRSPNRTPARLRRRVLHLHRKHRWGAEHIAHELGLAASTVGAILRAAGQGRLDRGDRASADPVHLYQREHPGELIHVDVKKLSAIPKGGGWRLHGRGNDGHGGHSGAGYRYIHSALDDRTRLAYSEILDDEQAATAAAFWARAAHWCATQGITCQQVITDRGACYRSGLWHLACARTGTLVTKTRPRRPQTNGKSNASTGSCSKNGPTSGPGPANTNASPATSGSATSTINTDPTARSAGSHPWPPSPNSPGTTSPPGTTSRHGDTPRSRARWPQLGCVPLTSLNP
jgi:Homeodomain-like domain/Integrase core domain